MTLTRPDRPHATIVGAGIVGMSCAHFLQREGFRVTVVDRVPPGQGCSFGNAGGVVPSSMMPTVHPGILWRIPLWLIDPEGPLRIRWSYLPKAVPWMLAAGRAALPSRVAATIAARSALSRPAVADHEALLAAAGAADMLVKTDGIELYDSERRFRADEADRQLRREHGYEPVVLSPGELKELEPDLAGDFHCGVTHGGWYHVTDPGGMVAAIAAAVADAGGEIVTDEVTHIAHDGARATTLRLAGGGERRLDRLVVAAGAYSHLIAAMLGSQVLLEAERGYHLTIPDPGVRIGRALTLAGKPGAISPMAMGLRVAGTDEFAGTEAEPDWRRADLLWKLARRALPALRPLDGSVSRWMGRRPGMPDSLPVISPSPRLANVWYGFGHGHLGLTWGPTTGRLVAEAMAGRQPGIGLAPYRIDRPL